MVGKKKRRAKSAGLLGNHQKCWVWGRHAVLESLRAGRWLPRELRVDVDAQSPADRAELTELAALHDVEVIATPGEELTTLCRSGEHQGLAARMPEYPYVAVEELLSDLPDRALVLVLCAIQDPFNFGSILRSADLFGVHGVIVPDRSQAEVSSHVARASVGAVNWLPIARTENLALSCRELRDRGLMSIAASESGTIDLTELQLKESRTESRPFAGVAILIGNEGSGVPAELLSLAQEQVRIPQAGHVGSLNAAVAAGILCYEIRKQLDSLMSQS